MGRPTDWSPLAGSDPVPGDPAGISTEAARLASVAQLIESQVAVLRKIAAGDSVEKGLHVEKLRSAAADTSGQLVKVVGRYQKTAAALAAWVPELEWAQSQSLKALTQAQEAAQQSLANQPIQRPPGTKPTPQEQQADQARARAVTQASDDLGAARDLLNQTVSYRDEKAGETARKIESAIDDGVVDGFWDHVSAFIHEYAGLLTDIATGLEFLATALAIAALFVSGIGFLLLASIIVAALLIRTVLAANGDGSWSDVALDAFALLTLGLASGAGLLLGRFAEGTAETAEQMLQGEQTLQELTGASKLADVPGGSDLLSQGSSGLKNALDSYEDSSAAERFVTGGDAEKATSIRQLSYLTKTFADSPAMQGIAAQTRVLGALTRGSYLVGVAPDWGDKIGSGLQLYGIHSTEQPAVSVAGPWSHGFQDWKDSWFPEGSVWPK
jgi:AcrR family transcriptional regulator